MRSRVNQLQLGTIEYITPVLRFREEKLEQMILPGKTITLDAGVISDNGVPMNLFFFSDDPRITVPRQLTVGRFGTFLVEVSTKGMYLGDKLTGNITVLYNGGTKLLPYEFSVVMAKNSEKEYEFADFDSFVRFYRRSRQEAQAVYSWEEFTDFPFMQDTRLRSLYYTYYRKNAWDKGLSEFLKAAGVRVHEERKVSDNTEKLKTLRDEKKDEISGNLRKQLKLEECLLKARDSFLSAEDVASVEDPGFEQLMTEYPDDMVLKLALSWFRIEKNDLAGAREILIKIQDPVQKERSIKKDIYCCFLYLVSRVQKNEDRQAMCVSLAVKYLQEGTLSRLMHFLVYHIDPRNKEDLSRAATFLVTCDLRGISDALLYQDMCELFEKSTSGFETLTETVLKAMLYGLREGKLSLNALFSLLSKKLRSMAFLPLYIQVLKTGWEVFHHKDLLKAVVDIQLQMKKKGEDALYWYREAVFEDIRMPGLFEAYYASQQQLEEEALPKDLLSYFADKNSFGKTEPDVLYANVLDFYSDDEEIYPLYKNQILTFALDKMIRGDYCKERIPVFKTILDQRFLDESTADGMLALLHLKRIRTSLSEMKRAVIHYAQLSRDFYVLLTDNEAYVPLWSSEAVIAFEDERGARYFDPDMQVSPVFEDQELKELCLLYRQDKLYSGLSDADKVLAEKTAVPEDLTVLEALLSDKNVDSFYKARIYETLIVLSEDEALRGIDFRPWLLEAPAEDLLKEYCMKLIKALIDFGEYKEAFEKIRSSSFEGIPEENLHELCTWLLSENAAKDDVWLKAMCRHLLKSENAGNQEYVYLARFFEGPPEEMVSLVSILRKKRLPDHGFIEKTFIECFYVQENRFLDQLYEAYYKDPSRDRTVTDAYLVLKCHDAFINRKRIPENAYRELKENVMSLPRVCLLALITLLSRQRNLGEADVRLAERCLDRAVRENIVLKCFYRLENRVKMPPELEGRVYVEYRSNEAEEVSVIGQILPVRRYFHRTLNEIYPGVFTRSFVLYKREWIEYYYSVRNRDGSTAEKEGNVIVQENDPKVLGSRYDDITRLQQMADRNETQDASKLVRSMLLKELMIDEIFGDE